MQASLRLALGMTTRIPAGDVSAIAARPQSVGWAVLLTPLIWAVAGIAAVAILLLIRLLIDWPGGPAGHLGPILGAIGAIGFVQWLARGLHADGLADTADALAAPGDRDQKLTVMRASDIGPTGVLVLGFVLSAQVVCLAISVTLGHGSLALITALIAGRLCLAWACLGSAARDSGLGSWVSQTVRWPAVVLVSAAYFGLAGLGLWLDDEPVRTGSLIALLAIPVAIAITQLFYRTWRRSLGGITGDTLGAGVEAGTLCALFIFAISG
ncbi:MAG: adenosylcobinamide-GDP ribazoletransferase [Actinomycetia bacterium]|nr:adenosylcobinamide-GDP ribazoletransferase [Actinomycetes bacterium]